MSMPDSEPPCKNPDGDQSQSTGPRTEPDNKEGCPEAAPTASDILKETENLLQRGIKLFEVGVAR